MGLDWIAIDNATSMNQIGYFRGKGVSYDTNVEDEMDCNMCYGEGNDHMMTENQRQAIIKCLKELLHRYEQDEDEIFIEDGETADEWITFMQDALEFLETYEYIHCSF